MSETRYEVTREDLQRAMGPSAMEAYDVYHQPDDPPGRFNEDLEWPGETEQRDILRDVVQEVIPYLKDLLDEYQSVCERRHVMSMFDCAEGRAIVALFDETEEK